LPEAIRKQMRINQIVRQNWTIEQGALALACIDAGVKVQYLDGTYNSWGGEPDFHVLHCFKSLYQFDRRTMFAAEAHEWIGEYLDSDIPGKAFLGGMMRQYLETFPGVSAEKKGEGPTGKRRAAERVESDSLSIDSLDALPELEYCSDRADAGLRHRFLEAVSPSGNGLDNIFNPSFHESPTVDVYAFRAIPAGARDLESFVSVDDRSGRSLHLLSPARFPDLDAPRLIDPKLFTIGEAVFATFNSGWVPNRGNDIFVMQVHPTLGEPRKVQFDGRGDQERNWAFFSEGGEIFAIYRIAPLVILRLERSTDDAWRMVEHFRQPDTDLPHDLTLGTQPSLHEGRHYFMAHRKYLLGRRKVYLGRLCALEPGARSVTAGLRWIAHSSDSLLGSEVKHNTNLHSCTYFSGLQASDAGIALGYGINDVSFGFCRYGHGELLK
jgi:hypothetical protein